MLDHAAPLNDTGPQTPAALPDPLVRLGGGDDDIASSCSSYDRMILRQKGLVILLGYTTTFLVWSIGLTMFTGTTPLGLLAAALLALAPVGVVFAYDRSILLAGWLAAGRATLMERGALDLPRPGLGTRLTRAIGLLPRLIMPFAMALSGTALALIVALGPELAHWQNQEDGRRNAAAYAAGEASLDVSTAAARAALEEAAQAHRRLMAERDTLLTRQPEGPSHDREVAALLARRDLAQTRQAAVEAEATQREQDASAERFGLRIRPDHSGRPGLGPLAQFHSDRAGQSRAEAARLLGETEALTAQLNTLREQARDERAAAAAGRAARLQALEARLSEAGARRERADAELRALVRDRSEAVIRLARARPDYIPPKTGVLGGLDALHGHATESWPRAAWMLALKAFLICLELLVPFMVLRLPPTGYAVRLALQYEGVVREATAASFGHDLANRLRASARAAVSA